MKRAHHYDTILQNSNLVDNIFSGNIDKKFAAHYDAIEMQLKSETVGLVTLDEMKAKQEDAVKVSRLDTII